MTDDWLPREQPGRPSIAGFFAPSPVYVTGEDHLRVTAYSNTANVVLAVNSRILRPDSEPIACNDTISPGSGRTATQKIVPLSEGWLLGVVVSAGGSSALGATWVSVDLVRGAATGTCQLVQNLGSEYVTLRSPWQWPGTSELLSTDGSGVLRSITGATPAAGAEIAESVPAGARWKLLAFEADLATSATVANRVPGLLLDDGANVFAWVSTGVNETASLTWRNSFQSGTSQLSDPTNHVIMTSLGDDLVLGAGFRIRTSTVNLQAADQYAAPQYLVREWLEGL